MSYMVAIPEDRFSRDEAQIMCQVSKSQASSHHGCSIIGPRLEGQDLPLIC